MTSEDKHPELLESLSKGLALLRLFGTGVAPMTIQEAASRLEVTRAAARRLLLTLQHHGYVAENGTAYALTPRVMELGYAYFAGIDLPRLSKAAMQELAGNVRETCSLGVLDGPFVAMIAREEPERLLRLDLAVGRRLPAYAHSLGRQLLAHLDAPGWAQYLNSADIRKLTPRTVSSRSALEKSFRQIRRDGYCIVMDEMLDGVGGISVAIRDGAGTVVAAMAVSMVLGKRSRECIVADYLAPLQAAAGAVETLLHAVKT